MNKKVSLGVAVAFTLIVATATFAMTMVFSYNQFNEMVSDLNERQALLGKYSEIDNLVRRNYFGTVNEVVLMDSVARGYMAGIGDQYSEYLDQRAYERIIRAERNNNAGIGAVLRIGPEGFLEVLEVYPDSPAQMAGIQPGDLIVKMDDVDLVPENSHQMLEAIQGEPGTRVALVVRKGSEDVTLEPLTRRQVITPTVKSRMLDEHDVGYIIIDEFIDSTTSDQFNRELQRMIDEGAKSLIIDLRDNPGGSLRWTTRILNRLLPPGPIASSTDRFGNNEVLHSSDANEIGLPVVVITNNATASAAELFAQSLKDYGKGRSVGTVTAGKGVIQEMFPLSDGSALRLTVALLNSASGETFNGVGVRPDYEVTMDGDWKTMEEPESSDLQLRKAIEVAVSMHKVEEAQQAQQEQPQQPPPQQPQPPPEDDEGDEEGDGERNDENEGSEDGEVDTDEQGAE